MKWTAHFVNYLDCVRYFSLASLSTSTCGEFSLILHQEGSDFDIFFCLHGFSIFTIAFHVPVALFVRLKKATKLVNCRNHTKYVYFMHNVSKLVFS